jgi:hypothetical protein
VSIRAELSKTICLRYFLLSLFPLNDESVNVMSQNVCHSSFFIFCLSPCIFCIFDTMSSRHKSSQSEPFFLFLFTSISRALHGIIFISIFKISSLF